MEEREPHLIGEAPAAPATLSDQKNTPNCTIHSIGKCLVNGFENSKFKPPQKLDFNQDDVIGSLEKTFKVEMKRWPNEFNNIVLNLDVQQKLNLNKKEWEVKLDVQEIKKYEFENDRKSGHAEHVLVADPQKNGNLHSMYVKYYDPQSKMLSAINSWGCFMAYPDVHINDVIKIYRVRCLAMLAIQTMVIQMQKAMIRMQMQMEELGKKKAMIRQMQMQKKLRKNIVSGNETTGYPQNP